MYKLAAIDLDGTLLTPEKLITSRSVEAIKAWRANGLKVVLATARPFYRLGRYLQMLDMLSGDEYAISFNGGIVMRTDGQERIYSHSFARDEIDAVTSYGATLGVPIFLYLEDKIISNRDEPLYRKKNPDVDFRVAADLSSIDLDRQAVYKVAYVGTPEEVKGMRRSLPADLEHDFEVSSSVPQFVDFVPLGTSKAKALEMIGTRLGVSRSEMIAFGDEDNDIPMLKFVGLGIAMENAAREVREVAGRVCESNANDGVARVLEDLITRDSV